MTTSAVANNQSELIYSSLAARSDEKDLSVVNEAENRFLTLLTTQLKNQDPLSPMENAELTSQLAQISTVNGVEKLNATLQTLLSGMTETQAMQAASLVNRGVLVPGSAMALGEQGGIGGLELASSADEVTVTIKDANGLVMRTLNLGAQEAGVHPFVWDGKTDSGEAAALGNYSYSVSAKRGTETTSATALAYGLVQAVTRNGSSLSLDVGTLGAFTMTDVKQIL
ncbi:MAG: flagellar hook assembly protein FlgD [Rhodocyclaceae bacterium]|jgi:flagellar basal-body rod modification protein FlgD|nr:flagellar hook assembly protein FlgD [Rhodocyclaceae bacterium]